MKKWGPDDESLNKKFLLARIYKARFLPISSSNKKGYLLVSISIFKQIRNIHKQPSRGVLIKWCPENLQQIYRRTPMLKCDLFIEWVFSCKFTACFQSTFPKNLSGWLRLNISTLFFSCASNRSSLSEVLLRKDAFWNAANLQENNHVEVLFQ